MDEQDIQGTVRQEMANGANSSRFGMSSTGFHTHDGTNSPSIFLQTINFVGRLEANGAIDFAPRDWKVTKVGTGDYKITHNLNTKLSIAIGTTHNQLVSQVTALPNSFEIVWRTTGGAATDTQFNFMLTAVVNGNNAPLIYKGLYVT